MDTALTTRAALAKLNQRTADVFLELAPRLRAKLDDPGFEAFASQVLEIAGSGWRAFESARAYMEVAESLVAEGGQQALLDAGAYGQELAGFSYEPGATWFRGLGGLAEKGALDRAAALESSGRLLQARYPHASSLITGFFRTGFEIADSSSFEVTATWGRAAVAMATDRVAFNDFLETSGKMPGLDWAFVDELRQQTPGAASAWLEHWPSLAGLANEAVLRTLVKRWAMDADGVGRWLPVLQRALAGLGPAERQTLWRLLAELPSVELALALMTSLDRLPMTKPAAVLAWLEEVHKFLPLREEAAKGHLALESASSERLLERLRGQVNLVDVRRVLQLLAEAVSGTRLAIEPVDTGSHHFRDLPTTDGLTIRLPEAVSRYPDPESNFELYKVALFHQLGYFEFGTFEFEWGSSVAAFRDFFRQFSEPALAAELFQILEDARIDWALARHYRGAAPLLARFKADALPVVLAMPVVSRRGALLRSLLAASLDGDAPVQAALEVDAAELRAAIERLRSAEANVFVTMEVLTDCYDVMVKGTAESQESIELIADQEMTAEEAEEAFEKEITVEFRGHLEPDRARINQQLAALEPEEVDNGDGTEPPMSGGGEVDPRELRIEQLRRGDVQNAIGMVISDLDGPGEKGDEQPEDDDLEVFRGVIDDKVQVPSALAFQYDEWDDVIGDYRRRWCTLYETRELDDRPEFVENALRELRSVGSSVRRQLTHLRPELLRKVKGVEHGEELDLEKTIEAVVDRRAGLSPGERIYVQRIRRDRDVSALFLLDMSASTDDRIPSPDPAREAPPSFDEDDFLHDWYGSQSDADERKRIIDVEKEAVVLMAEALEVLGDSYSICGFSGYGRDKVDFYLCKDFDEPYNIRVKGRVGGMKPCRSTRMGPAIRHATRRLGLTESRTKALIIISDGYPQDHDYGRDRNSKEYGIRDTTMALTEARRKGIQPFCLTVDPSGHDYLREMCPDQQYMVIQDIAQLPDELSKVYRSLTA